MPTEGTAVNWLQVFAYIAMIITPLLLGGAIWFAYTQWRSAQNTRMAQIILSITERWDSQPMEGSRQIIDQYKDELKSKIKQANEEQSPEIFSLIRAANFFDAVGLLVVEGLLKCEMTYKLFGETEENFYRIYKPILEDPKTKQYFKYFVALHKEFEEESKKEKEGRVKIQKQKSALEKKAKTKRRRVT